MFIDTVDEAAATGPIAEYYKQQREAWGFLPNYALAFSPRPDVAQAWNLLNSTIRNGMDRRRFELATIAAARALKSTYCTAAHATFLRDICQDEESLHRIARSPDGADLEPQDRAVYRFATKVATDASSVSRRTLTDSELWACLMQRSPTSCMPPRPVPSSPGSSTASAPNSTHRPRRPSTSDCSPR